MSNLAWDDPEIRRIIQHAINDLRSPMISDMCPETLEVADKLQMALNGMGEVDDDPEPIAEADAAERFSEACARQKREREEL